MISDRHLHQKTGAITSHGVIRRCAYGENNSGTAGFKGKISVCSRKSSHGEQNRQESHSFTLSGAGAVWTVYTYDGLGRTTRVTNPDSSHKDYASLGNTVTATDEAGAWKKYTMDAMGNLTQVEEPNPAGGAYSATPTMPSIT